MKKSLIFLVLVAVSLLVSFAPHASGQDRGTINGHSYVDLGLSVKWATCNIGASSPSNYGDYYAWGETKTKSIYNIDNCVTYGKMIRDVSRNSTYDVAYANWGGTWRLPTRDEIAELKNRCSFTWTTLGGHKGYKVTGPNGNSIFLPAAGWCYWTTPTYAEEKGNYWSSTPDGEDTTKAVSMGFGDDFFNGYMMSRNYGFSVRPVSD